MGEKSWVSMIPKLSLKETKGMILSLSERLFPAMEASEKQAFLVKLLGLSGDDELSSMASR